ncbi:hypothetical protein PVAP13_9KG045457 [Panicum virgatum]|uniref:Uncharacterized protein n=1 Tax=Panicum virgatum TaxID=38727 RepID=A0A8T0NI71_PANVG|nr:hypothetical protein PVAP13_9KG045457 [Panicum virgatum]
MSRKKQVLQARPSQNVSAISPRQRCQPFRNCRPVQRASGERWFEDESSEWGKIKHVQQLKAHGHKTEEEEESEQSSQEDEEANEEEAEQSEEADADEEKPTNHQKMKRPSGTSTVPRSRIPSTHTWASPQTKTKSKR